MATQRRSWALERVGWSLMLLLIALALLGLFARGPLSQQRISDPSGRLEIEFERFNRSAAPASMRMRLDSGTATQASVRLGPRFLRAFTIETIQPAPSTTRLGPEGIELEFATTGDGPGWIHLDLRPDGFGLVRSEIALDGGEPVTLTQFIYP